MKLPWMLLLALLAAGAFGVGCSSGDDDDDCHCPAADDDQSPGDDDDDDNDDNDDDNDDNNDSGPVAELLLGAPARTAMCGPEQSPPAPYNPYETVWTAFVFDGEDLPFYGMYAYFWVDRYAWNGCSYVNTVSGLFLKDGGIDENAFAGGLYSGYPVEYLATDRFAMNVFPFLNVRRDPDFLNQYHLDAVGPEFQGSFDLECRHLRAWWIDYYSCYDAALTDAVIDYRGQRYYFQGSGAYERWWGRGGFDPAADEDNVVHGYWIYALMHWEDGEGTQAHSLVWTRYDLETTPDPFYIVGELSVGDATHPISGGELNVDFPENAGSGGYLRKHQSNVTLADGGSFTYVAQVVKEYHDYRPLEGQTPETQDDREAHTYTVGVMDYDGKTWQGRGNVEWRVTEVNPLPEQK